jgi:hypothetical protein
MVQVYFLLVLANVLSGLVLAREGLKMPLASWQGLFVAFESKSARLVLGVASFLSGFVALIFVLPGDQLFVGDLLPALTGLLAGTVLVLDFYAKPQGQEQNSGDLLLKNRVLIGLVGLTFGVIHFFVPGLLLL